MELKVKLKRDYPSKTETLVLVNYERTLQRIVRVTYPRYWDCEELCIFIQQFHDMRIRKPYSDECSLNRMKDILESVKGLGYQVIAINRRYGYIVRNDGKFLAYHMGRYSSKGGICLTYKYKPSVTQGSGTIQGGESAYNFGYTEFNRKMIDEMMEHPKLYGRVEHYKDFREFCKHERRFNSVLGKFI